METEARCQWLRPVILATQETETRRFEFRSQLGNDSQVPIWKKKKNRKKVLEKWLKV
jgi:hypothetical protein